MNIIFTILFILIIICFFYFLNIIFMKSENFCYSNNYCKGNSDSRLCINQQCRTCGLLATCNKDSECAPNNCIDGCCDQ